MLSIQTSGQSHSHIDGRKGTTFWLRSTNVLATFFAVNEKNVRAGIYAVLSECLRHSLPAFRLFTGGILRWSFWSRSFWSKSFFDMSKSALYINNNYYLYIVSKWPNPKMKMTKMTLTTLTTWLIVLPWKKFLDKPSGRAERNGFYLNPAIGWMLVWYLNP